MHWRDAHGVVTSTAIDFNIGAERSAGSVSKNMDEGELVSGLRLRRTSLPLEAVTRDVPVEAAEGEGEVDVMEYELVRIA